MSQIVGNRIDLLSPISVIKGFGEKRVAAFNDSDIFTVEDFLYRLPRKYVDRSRIVPLSELESVINQTVTVTGEITIARVERGKRSRFRIQITDDSGSIEMIWFNQVGYLRKMLVVGKSIRAAGIVKKQNHFQMVHPEIEVVTEDQEILFPFEPRYSITQAMRKSKIGQKRIIDSMSWLFKNVTHFPEKLPEIIEKRYEFPSLKDSLYHLHFPKHPSENDHWMERLRYEELYQTALNLRWVRRDFALPGCKMKSEQQRQSFLNNLPFELTEEQQRAVNILEQQSASPNRMHHLLQGDVGCGKTVVAFTATLPALESGFQVAWITPTEVLAKQSFREIESWLLPLGITPVLLTGSTSAGDKRAIIRGLKMGTIPFVVGTHSLLQDRISFDRLRMVVVDEQHRFGAEQRLKLQQKSPSADLLMMSATPIPQSLAATIYSDLELVTIRSLPNGRKPVKTHLVAEEKREGMESFIHDRVQTHNERVFWVVPRIESTEDEGNELADIEQRYKQLSTGPFRGISIAVVHGGMSSIEKEQAMYRFSIGESPILLATTVIEVGVNVPEATVMVIENSERFGLAQLHQLRGRVGRSSLESWAFLLGARSLSEESVFRLKRFTEAKDGFEIAELDLSLRGTGQVAGFRQSGFSELQFSNILEDAPLFKQVVEDIDTVLQP